MLKSLDKNGKDNTGECQYYTMSACLGEPWCSVWYIYKEYIEAVRKTNIANKTKEVMNYRMGIWKE